MGWYERAKDKAKYFEGCVTHMYKDSEGFITVGIGFLIDTINTAAQYSFVKRVGGTQASYIDIANDWNTVKPAIYPKPWTYYKPFTKLDLPMTVINSKFDIKFWDHVKDAPSYLPSFYDQPDACKEAVADMIYNMGLGSLNIYQQMKACIENGDWEGAAKQSHRVNIQAERNTYVYDLFMSLANSNNST